MLVHGSGIQGQPLRGCQLSMALGGALQQGREFDLRKLRLAGLSHFQEIM